MTKYTEACKKDGIKRTFEAWMKIFADKENVKKGIGYRRGIEVSSYVQPALGNLIK